MTAVLLALASAALFGAMTIAVRVGPARGGDAGGAALATVLPALGVALVAALVPPRLHRRLAVLPRRAARAGRLADPLHARSARDRRVAHVGHGRCGAARRRRDRARLPRRAGARRRSWSARSRSSRAGCCSPPSATGPVTCAAAGCSMRAGGRRALRDARQHRPRAPRPCDARRRRPPRRSLAGASSLASGRGALPTAPRAPAARAGGLLFGLSYICLFEAYFRGRVTVVSPLVATESLWGVALAALVFRHTEGMGRRLVARAPSRSSPAASLIGVSATERSAITA